MNHEKLPYRPSEQPTLEFDRIAFLLNPGSSHSDRMTRFLSLILEEYDPKKVKIIKTQKCNLPSKRNEEVLASELEAGDLIIAAGGDKTVNIAVNALALDGLDEDLRQTPILPARGGKVSVMSKLLTGANHPGNFLRVMREGLLVPVRPVACEVDPENEYGPFTIRAAFSVGVGLTGMVVKNLGEDKYRYNFLSKNKYTSKLNDAAAAIGGIATSPLFDVEEDHLTRQSFEVLISNAEEMAGGLMRFPKIKLAKSELFQVEIPKKTVTTVGLSAVRLATGTMSGDHILTDPSSPPWRLDFTVHPPEDRELYAQFDGEPYQISDPTRFSLTHSEQTFQAVTYETSRKAA
ncbi:MAG TPA: hypothetical protein VMR08_02730 [Patescibacteria group bacterium]|nr:hypothetical protein [Patescibacteria group bacterium]